MNTSRRNMGRIVFQSVYYIGKAIILGRNLYSVALDTFQQMLHMMCDAFWCCFLPLNNNVFMNPLARVQFDRLTGPLLLSLTRKVTTSHWRQNIQRKNVVAKVIGGLTKQGLHTRSITRSNLQLKKRENMVGFSLEVHA